MTGQQTDDIAVMHPKLNHSLRLPAIPSVAPGVGATHQQRVHVHMWCSGGTCSCTVRALHRCCMLTWIDSTDAEERLVIDGLQKVQSMVADREARKVPFMEDTCRDLSSAAPVTVMAVQKPMKVTAPDPLHARVRLGQHSSACTKR